MKLALLSIAVAAAAVQPVRAQNQLPVNPPPIETISVTEMIGIAQGLGLQATLKIEDPDNIKYIEAMAANGGVVFFALRGCDGPGQAARCQLVESFGYFEGSGVTLDQINTFNQEKTAVSTASLDREGDGIISAKHFLNYGVTANHLAFRIALFFVDIDAVLMAFKPGVVAQVRFQPLTPSDEAETAALLPAAAALRTVNAIGRDSPVFATEAVRGILDGQARE